MAERLVAVWASKAPSLGPIEFDAIISDTLDSRLNISQYPMEGGQVVVDNAILLPRTLSMVAAIGSRDLDTLSVGNIANTLVGQAQGGLLGAVSDIGDSINRIEVLTGQDISWAMGGEDKKEPEGTRSADALKFLITLQANRELIDIQVNEGNILFRNMILKRISRTNDLSNEGGMMCTLNFQEVPMVVLASEATTETDDDTAQEPLELGWEGPMQLNQMPLDQAALYSMAELPEGWEGGGSWITFAKDVPGASTSLGDGAYFISRVDRQTPWKDSQLIDEELGFLKVHR